MAGAPLDGDAAPEDGGLPAGAAERSAGRDLGVYVHVPFCRTRCGYCDFNTYTAEELRGAKRSDYADEAVAELAFAEGVLDRAGLPRRAASTVFFGGGTPTLLPPDDLARMLDGVRRHVGIEPGAEVTTEANPDSVDAAALGRLRDAGFTRVSFGVQSAVPSTLAALERTHDPERVPEVVAAAREAGLGVSVDLIYGAPGETLEDWRRSVELAVSLAPDHVSAYALIIEQGTKLARQIRAGEAEAPDDDLQADMYELADDAFAAAGLDWYEISNWAASPADRSRHNRSYWTGQDWWGVGPGAHSHVGGVRWWNVKHPAAYASRIAAGVSPAMARETLDPEQAALERVLLGSRIREGIAIDDVPAQGRSGVPSLIADGLVDGRAAIGGRVVLTRRGRLLADAVVRALVP